MLVRVGDAMDIEKARRDEGTGAVTGGRRTFAEQFDLEAALLSRFPQSSLLRLFIQFDVAAQRQPLVELAMMNQQHAPVVNDENRDGKINLLVNVSHGGKLKDQSSKIKRR